MADRETDEPGIVSGRAAVTNIVVAFLASMVGGTIFLLFGVLLKAVTTRFQISSTEAALIYLAQWLAFGAASWMLGVYSDRIGVIAAIRVGLLLIVAGLVLVQLSLSYATFVVGFGLLTGAGLSSVFGPLHNLVLSTTRERWRGTALGVVMAAQGVGPVALVPAVSGLNESRGLRSVVIALVVTSVVLAALSLLLRDAPRPAADTREKNSSGGLRGADPRAHGLPNLRVTAAHLLGCASHTIPLVYVVDLAKSSAGFSPVKAASILSVISAASIASRLLAPAAGNVTGSVPVLLGTLPLQLVGMVLFIVFQHESLALYYVAATFFGLGFGSEMVMFSLLSRQRFEGKIGGILGVQLLGAGLGMGGGVLAAGLLLSAGASYVSTFAVALAAGVLAEVVLWSLRSQPVEPAPAGAA